MSTRTETRSLWSKVRVEARIRANSTLAAYGAAEEAKAGPPQLHRQASFAVWNMSSLKLRMESVRGRGLPQSAARAA